MADDSISTTQPPQSHETTKPEGKKGVGSRFAVATAFALLGKKLAAIVGTTLDAKAAYKGFLRDGKPLTFIEKIKGIWDGTLIEAYTDKLIKAGALAKNAEGTSMGKIMGAAVKMHKGSVVSLFLTGAAFFAVGWWRGSKLKNAHELIEHPIRSLKIIAGFTKPDKPEEHDKKTLATDGEAIRDVEDARKWREYVASQKQDTAKDVTPRGSYMDAASREEPSAGAAVSA
jgi:hypothetical protein